MCPPTAHWRQNYKIELLPGLPAIDCGALEFRATDTGVGREGLVVEVHVPNGRWIGNFQRGDGTLSQVISTPASDRLCVIAGGRGYWVNVLEPSMFELIPAYPIREMRASSESGLLIFADDTDLAAYDCNGRRWVSGRVSWDGVEIISVTAAGVEGRGWDSVNEAPVGFFVDAETGRVEGGAAPRSRA